MFDYSGAGIHGASLPENLGFAGFRLNFHTDWVRDLAAFQGASYFRAVDGDLQYGMSQRGLAIDGGLPTPEEFPDFVAYYLERPAKDSSRITSSFSSCCRYFCRLGSRKGLPIPTIRSNWLSRCVEL